MIQCCSFDPASLKKSPFTQKEAYFFFKMLLEGRVEEEAAMESLLIMNRRQETKDELLGAIQAVREQDHTLNPSLKKLYHMKTPHTLDVCGTGGDGSGSFNISTTSLFIVAACGIPIAKHGNRSISSRCGSSDVLEALGVKITLDVMRMRRIFEACGIAYLHAPLYHPSFQKVQTLRKKIKRRTIFNLLGPVLNPYAIDMQMTGVYSKKLFSLYANVFQSLKRKHFTLVCGKDQLDEVSRKTSTNILEFHQGKKRTYTFNLQQLKLQKEKILKFKNQNAKSNAALLVKILKNEAGRFETELVLLNSAFALLTAQKCKTIQESFATCQETLESGKAYLKLKEFLRLTS